LWKSILILAKAISEDLYEGMKDFAIKKSKQRKEDEKDTIKHCIVQILLEIVKEDNWYSNKDILESIKDEFQWITPQLLGYELKSLGLKSRKSNKSKKYFLSVESVKDIAERLGVKTGDSDE